MFSRTTIIALYKFAAVAFAAVLLPAAHSFAQAYKEDSPDPQFKKFERVGGSEAAKDAARMLSGQAGMDGAETVFTQVLDKGVYPFLTHRENLTNWYKMKKDIKQKYFNPAKVQAALDLVNQITLRKMNEYATENYHIMARYQAMIFIGELNQTFASVQGKQIVALPQALPVMIKAANDPRLPTAVRIAALLGIQRHAEEATLPADAKKSIATAMLALVKTKEPAPSESQEGQDWLRRRAADIAAAVGVTAPEVKELVALNEAAAAQATAPAILVPVPKLDIPAAKKETSPTPLDPFAK